MNGQLNFVGIISLILYFILYPISIVPFALRFFYNKEYKLSTSFKRTIELSLFSTIIAASASLQLMFNHLDIIQQLNDFSQNLIFTFFSIVLFTGAYFFIKRVPNWLKELLNSNNEYETLIAKILKPLSIILLISYISISVSFISLFIPSLLFVYMLLPYTILFYTISLTLFAIFSLVIIVLNRKSKNLIYVLLLIGGDLLVLLLFFMFPPAVNPLRLPLLFIYHYFALFYIIFKTKPSLQIDIATDEDKKVRLIDSGLSKRESEIAVEILNGLSYKGVSEKLNISLSTVQTHITKIYKKLNVNSKIELQRYLEGFRN